MTNARPGPGPAFDSRTTPRLIVRRVCNGGNRRAALHFTSLKPRILVVDDSPTVRGQVTAALAATYECLTASDGAEGLQVAITEMPDAVIADLEMPNMDGVELLRALRGSQATQAIPVIIVTTVTNVKSVNECRSLGCDGFALKPVEPEYLRVKLRQVLNARAQKKK